MNENLEELEDFHGVRPVKGFDPAVIHALDVLVYPRHLLLA